MKKPWIQTFALWFVLVIATPLGAAAAEGGPIPAREFRAAWVATVYNLDWPSRPGLAEGVQKAQLRAIMDRAADLRLNAILLQVRPESDALFPSRREPWSQFLTGRQGMSPGYDPLQYAIEQAHARGIELHAWFNPFRAGIHTNDPRGANHVTQTHPEWIRRAGAQLWIDPGIPEARRYVIETILDVVRRYDIDGVHIDDYFYPYPKKGVTDFADGASWARYGAESGLSRADWRRENINSFVEALHRGIKAQKGGVRFGISPFGIWRPGVPPSIQAQLDSYGQLYADSRKWLREGWCDYLAPQLYWSIEPAKQSFPVLLSWWRGESLAGKPIWPGIATERIGAQRPAQEMVDQIMLSRRGLPASAAPGHIHWSMKALMRDQGGVNALLKRTVYREVSEPPRR